MAKKQLKANCRALKFIFKLSKHSTEADFDKYPGGFARLNKNVQKLLGEEELASVVDETYEVLDKQYSNWKTDSPAQPAKRLAFLFVLGKRYEFV